MISKRGLWLVIGLLLVADLGLALCWHPLPPAHERELPLVTATTATPVTSSSESPR